MLPLLALAGGAANTIGGLIGGGARRREQRQAQAQLRERMDAYEGMEFQNPFANMENTMEDLTVNQQQAQFLAQQQQQGLANTMGALQGAAGGSGIAALAQAMANQQAQNLQAASASIGQQESRNQMASAQMAGRMQMLEAQGESRVQDLEIGRTQTLLGMSQQRLAAANQARQQATNQLIGGIAGMGAGIVGGIAGNSKSEFIQGLTKSI